jgi:hypothetical protein
MRLSTVALDFLDAAWLACFALHATLGDPVCHVLDAPKGFENTVRRNGDEAAKRRALISRPREEEGCLLIT